MDSSPARVRAVITGLMLAIISASSLVAFSLLAGSADNPRIIPVVPHSASAAASPVVLGGDVQEEPTRVRIDTTDGERLTLTFDVADGGEAAVLGTRVRNHPRKSSDKNTSEIDEAPNTQFGRESEHVDCRCGSRAKDNAPNRNAYGHDKNKANGNAYGHQNARPGGHAKGSKKN